MAVKFVFCILMLSASLAHAWPHLYADPYPTTGVQPDTATFTVNGGAAQPCTLEAVGGGKQPKCDLAVISAPGTYTLILTVSRAAGCSNDTCWEAGAASSVPFSYTWAASVVTQPTGIVLRP